MQTSKVRDVGGWWAERNKCCQFLENVNFSIFFITLDHYCKVAFEDGKQMEWLKLCNGMRLCVIRRLQCWLYRDYRIEDHTAFTIAVFWSNCGRINILHSTIVESRTRRFFTIGYVWQSWFWDIMNVLCMVIGRDMILIPYRWRI